MVKAPYENIWKNSSPQFPQQKIHKTSLKHMNHIFNSDHFPQKKSGNKKIPQRILWFVSLKTHNESWWIFTAEILSRLPIFEIPSRGGVKPMKALQTFFAFAVLELCHEKYSGLVVVVSNWIPFPWQWKSKIIETCKGRKNMEERLWSKYICVFPLKGIFYPFCAPVFLNRLKIGI